MDVLLQEANVTDAVSKTVKSAFAFIHVSSRTNQIDESIEVNSELTLSQVSQKLSQS